MAGRDSGMATGVDQSETPLLDAVARYHRDGRYGFTPSDNDGDSGGRTR